MRKTKIICTLGPSTEDPKIIKELMMSGMNVARFNFSHQTHEEHKKRFEMVEKLRTELGLPIAMLLDTKGPEIRLGMIENTKTELVAGQEFVLTTENSLGNSKTASITYKGLPQDVEKGTRVLIDDGLIELKVLNTTQTDITCEVINGGAISNRKGINVPGVRLSMPYLSKEDEEDIIFGSELGFDFIAASFVRSADDVLAVKNILSSQNNHKIKLISKIENLEGVKNIDEIIRVSDGIMVARGDMGVEIPFEEIPVLQKMLIKKAYHAGKQVITATQMLESMMKNPRPTRAETTDVANAIYDGTSAIMLSGETAAGLYPVAALKTMARIAQRAEQDIDYTKRFRNRDYSEPPNVTNAISHATVTTALDLGATAIVTVTKTGQTAKMISKFRPLCPIIGCTTDEMVCRQMNLSWGVIPIMVDEKSYTDELFEHSVQRAVEHKLLSSGDLVVVTAGVPLGISGTTNLMKVHVVGHILVSGKGITQEIICGNLCVCKNEEEAHKTFKAGDILVIPETSNNILSIMQNASAIITEKDGINSHAAIVGLALKKAVILDAHNATAILKSGTTVTVDAGRGIVCNDMVAM
ncbi:MAG: pyruvate kinase [Oscillospiraceae bacterium]